MVHACNWSLHITQVEGCAPNLTHGAAQLGTVKAPLPEGGKDVIHSTSRQVMPHVQAIERSGFLRQSCAGVLDKHSG